MSGSLGGRAQASRAAPTATLRPILGTVSTPTSFELLFKVDGTIQAQLFTTSVDTAGLTPVPGPRAGWAGTRATASAHTGALVIDNFAYTDGTTTFSETFNKANGSLGPALSWTVAHSGTAADLAVVSNRGQKTYSGAADASWAGARADSDLPLSVEQIVTCDLISASDSGSANNVILELILGYGSGSLTEAGDSYRARLLIDTATGNGQVSLYTWGASPHLWTTQSVGIVTGTALSFSAAFGS